MPTGKGKALWGDHTPAFGQTGKSKSAEKMTTRPDSAIQRRSQATDSYSVNQGDRRANLDSRPVGRCDLLRDGQFFS